MCTTLEKQVGSYTKAITPLHSKRLQKICRDGKLFEYVLPKATETIKTNISLDQERKMIYLGKGTTGFFEEIKCRLIRPPVLHMPNKTGRFHLYSDTSKFATGRIKYRMENLN